MSDSSEYPLQVQDVAVAMIKNGEHILAVYNDKWSSFTLPMTKLRQWEDPNTTAGKRIEAWHDAAIRAVQNGLVKR